MDKTNGRCENCKCYQSEKGFCVLLNNLVDKNIFYRDCGYVPVKGVAKSS